MMTRDQQGVVLFLGLLLTAFFLLTSRPIPSGSPRPAGDRSPPSPGVSAKEEIWVEVDGPVRNRGIYLLEKGKSVLEAVEKAGGSDRGHSLSSDSAAVTIQKSGLLQVAGEGENKGQAALRPLDPPKMKVLSIPVNINTATTEELDILPGIGPRMAQAIVDFREAHGKFSALEDLQKIKGLGPRKLAAIRPHITLRD